jgi:hypothetical protein
VEKIGRESSIAGVIYVGAIIAIGCFLMAFKIRIDMDDERRAQWRSLPQRRRRSKRFRK